MNKRQINIDIIPYENVARNVVRHNYADYIKGVCVESFNSGECIIPIKEITKTIGPTIEKDRLELARTVKVKLSGKPNTRRKMLREEVCKFIAETYLDVLFPVLVDDAPTNTSNTRSVEEILNQLVVDGKISNAWYTHTNGSKRTKIVSPEDVKLELLTKKLINLDW